MADRHGPCTNNRLAELEQQVVQLTRERDEWAAKWQRMSRKYAELRWPGLTRIITGKDADGVSGNSDQTFPQQTPTGHHHKGEG